MKGAVTIYENKRRVKFVCEDQGILIFKEANGSRYYIRQEEGWFTCFPAGNDAEPCSPVKSTIDFMVEDSDGQVLLIENNGDKRGVMRMPWVVAKRKANEIAHQHNLISYEAWKSWLLDAQKQCTNADYSENWLYAQDERLAEKCLETYTYLGVEYQVIKSVYRHRVCNLRWVEYMIYCGEDTPYELCGYTMLD